MKEYKGTFPKTYDELIRLKGIGSYTAAAISSFCNNEARAVVDGNVYRVLSRIFGIAIPIDSTEGKKAFAKLAEELLSKKDPATHNQAIMEFGAVQCKPKNPACDSCPFQQNCTACAEGKINELPVKAKKTKVSERHFEYFVFHYKNSIYIKKRSGNDIWQNLFDFPMIESGTSLPEAKILQHATLASFTGKKKFELEAVSAVHKHVLSHQRIYARFWEIKVQHELKLLPEWKKIPVAAIHTYAWPRLIDKFLNNRYLR